MKRVRAARRRAIAGFDLDRAVTDAETLLEHVRHAGEGALGIG